MLINRPQSVQLGLTLPELLIGITIIGILAGVGIPSFQSWMVNIKIRTAAESILNGLQQARAEAVTRNTSIEFILGTDTSWVIRSINPAATIESRPAGEDSRSVTGTTVPSGATTITYNSFGQITTNADASSALSRVDLAASGGSRPLSVTVNAGGSVKMCNPALASSSHITAC